MRGDGLRSVLLRASWRFAKSLGLLRLDLFHGPFFRRLPRRLSERVVGRVQAWGGAALEAAGGPDRKRKVNLSLNRWEKRHRLTTLRSYPFRMYLEVTKRCNLACRMCGGRLLEAVDGRDMALSVVDRVSVLFPYLAEVCLFGFGESLLSPLFFPILQRMPPWVSTRLITNGTLLSPPVIRQLVEHGLKVLSVSLDAARPETHHRIRGGAHFQRIVEGIGFLQEEKKRRNRECPRLFLSFVLMRSNLEEFPAFVRLAADLGASAVTAGYLMVFTEDMRRESLFYHREEANRTLLQARREAAAAGIELVLPPLFDLNMDEPAGAVDNLGDCPEPWEFLYVQSDGTVIPCCTYSRIMGDLNREAFPAIWNGTEYRRLRTELTVPALRPRECRECLNRFWNANAPQQHFHLLRPPARDPGAGG